MDELIENIFKNIALFINCLTINKFLHVNARYQSVNRRKNYRKIDSLILIIILLFSTEFYNYKQVQYDKKIYIFFSDFDEVIREFFP